MADPVTIGFLAAEALALVAKAALEKTVGETVKDAYGALKAKIALWAEGDVAALEKAPDSNKRQELIAEEIDKQSPNELAEVRELALDLVDKLKMQERTGPIGVHIGRLEAMRVRLGDITVTGSSALGFRAKEVKSAGDFETGKISVSSTGGKSKR